MKITVIGHVCLDVIHPPAGEEVKSYGGIFFSIVTLANLLEQTDTVYPVFGVGKGDYDALMERFSAYRNVDVSGIYKFNGPTNEVRLLYKNSYNRIECSRHIAEPTPWKRIRPFLTTDMVLVNMISGQDILLETLDELRMEVRERHIPVYMDVHSLTLGIKSDYTRYHRPVENWRRWLFMLHAVQMNEEEAAVLSPEHLDEQTLANHTLALNTRALIVTRGDRGCTAYIGEHKHVRRFDVPGITTPGAVDPTGCGDVFAASYCARFLKGEQEPGDSATILRSAEFANNVAAGKTRIVGSTTIDDLAIFRLEKQSLSEHTS